MPVDFNNIPDELKSYPQFVLWRAIDNGKPKLDKVPWCPHDDRPASPTNASDWGTFAQCMNVGTQRQDYYAGIGFVLSKNDPFGFIDLDDFTKCGDSANAEKLQRDIFARHESYTELSPSGTGLHIIVRAPLTISGAKSQEFGVEVYTSERFMTMTGNVFRESEIKDCGENFHILWGQIKARQGGGFEYLGDYPQARFDNQIIEMALQYNSDTFRPLIEGKWADIYPSQSEADMSFLNIIAFYSKNFEQTKRIFMESDLYRPDKYDRREDLLDKQVRKAFDKTPPPESVEDNAMRFHAALEAQEAANTATSEEGSSLAAVAQEPGKALAAPEEFAWTGSPVKVFPPGLVGEIAQFIYDAAPRPVREVALAGALGFFAGITGRAYNVSATGLNQYIMLLARTGRGKEAIKSGISRLMHEIVGSIQGGLASAQLFEGPASFSAAPALTGWLANKSPSIISVMGEIGITIKRISGPNASTHDQGLAQALLDLWNKSGRTDTLNPRAYSDKEKNQDIVKSPAFSIVGESNPLTFWEGIDEGTIAGGLLPRFMIIEYEGERVKRNKNNGITQPSESLVHSMRLLMMRCLESMQSHRVTDVIITPEADRLFDAFDDKADAIMNGAQSNTAIDEVWNRAHLKALKLAALVAVGIDPIVPTVGVMLAQWAIAVVSQDAENVIGRFERGEVGQGARGEDEGTQIEDLRMTIGRWFGKSEAPKGLTPLMKEKVIVPYSLIISAMYRMKSYKNERDKARAVKRALDVLMDSGRIRQLSNHETNELFGNSQKVYQIIHPTYFTSAWGSSDLY